MYGLKYLKVIAVELFVSEYVKSTTVIDFHSGILHFMSRESIRKPELGI